MAAAETAILITRRAQYRDYPEDLKAAVIAAIERNGGNVLATSKLFNLPADTVRYWWANSDRFREIQAASSGNLADKLEFIAHNAADSLAEHDLGIVTAKDKAAVLSVVVDKMQLLRGQPTSINLNVDSSDLADSLASALMTIDVTPEP